jgi:hypothetical protein
MVMLPKEKEDERDKSLPPGYRYADENMVRLVSDDFIAVAKQILPSPEKLGEMLHELENMREFMKEGEGSKVFEHATSTGDTVMVTRVEGGCVLTIHTETGFIPDEHVDDHINNIKRDFEKFADKTVTDIAMELWDMRMRNGEEPDGFVRLGNARVSVGFMKKVKERILQTDPDDVE